MPTTRKEKAFTLIELLVVISIIAILSVIGIVAYSTFLKNSRDQRRQSDLKLLQSALEDYHADSLFYPTAGGMNGILPSGGTFSNTTGLGSAPTPAPTPLPKTYLNAVPKDPLTSNSPYYYIGSTTTSVSSSSTCDNSSSGICLSFCLYAKMEGSTTPTSDANCASPFPSPYNYAVSRP